MVGFILDNNFVQLIGCYDYRTPPTYDVSATRTHDAPHVATPTSTTSPPAAPPR